MDFRKDYFKLILYRQHYLSIYIIFIGLIFINWIEYIFHIIKFEFELFSGLLILQFIYPLLNILSFDILYIKEII